MFFTPNAVHLLEINQDKIDWQFLSSNPNSIHLLEKNINKIHWEYLSENLNIFTYDKETLQEQFVKLTIFSKLF